jgi:methionyl-tRNA synthetase
MAVSAPPNLKDRVRPTFPRRAVITAGMPYGNKDLHFGHVGGVFVHADALARFLRDRIGAENVIFVSGTDCYGSAIVADYEKRVADGDFSGDIMEFVTQNHFRQAQTLRDYAIEPDCFAASALEPYVSIHEQLGADILETLHQHGHLEKRTTPQFYDVDEKKLLNGRQVKGRCPIDGCRSDSAYADECSLGHQYEPSDLIDPVSTLTGKRPEMRDVTNWYVRMERFRDALQSWLGGLLEARTWRDYSVRALLRYFEPPTIYMKREQIDDNDQLIESLPEHRRERGRGDSDKLVFHSLDDQDAAKAILSQNRCRYRSGATLFPFRLTGNLAWGLPVPELDGLSDLTFWVWPESLWAPISFTAARLQALGRDPAEWTQWWCAKDAGIYQVIGEDNLFFYGLAEGAIFLGMQGERFQADPPEDQLQLPHLIANRHVLFLDKKASSSGKVKPPMAAELLEYYTADQLRIHFLSLGLGSRNVSFRPKPLDPNAPAKASDPVLKDGNILSNAFNKAVRSCFYTAQKFYDRRIPAGTVSPDVLQRSRETVLDYEAAMAHHEFHTAITAAADYVRELNKRWAQHQPFYDDCEPAVRKQTVIDAFHMVRTAVVLMHPIAPVGTEKVREQLGVGSELWDWNRIFEPLDSLIPDLAEHRFAELPPKADFFEKPACQVGDSRP